MKKSIIIVFIAVLLLVIPSSAYADETTECNHQYKITHFDEEGTATVKCCLCGNTYKDTFINHINTYKDDENYTAIFDVYPDGVINAKDYHILSSQVYGDNFTVIDLSTMSDNLEYIKYVLIFLVFAVAVIIGCFFLKHLSFWKW